MKATLKPFTVEVQEIMDEDQAKQLRKEMNRRLNAGDFILTYPNGTRTPIGRDVFHQIYDVVAE